MVHLSSPLTRAQAERLLAGGAAAGHGRLAETLAAAAAWESSIAPERLSVAVEAFVCAGQVEAQPRSRLAVVRAAATRMLAVKVFFAAAGVAVGGAALAASSGALSGPHPGGHLRPPAHVLPSASGSGAGSAAPTAPGPAASPTDVAADLGSAAPGGKNQSTAPGVPTGDPAPATGMAPASTPGSTAASAPGSAAAPASASARPSPSHGSSSANSNRPAGAGSANGQAGRSGEHRAAGRSANPHAVPSESAPPTPTIGANAAQRRDTASTADPVGGTSTDRNPTQQRQGVTQN